MLCPKCQTENSDSAKFCKKCGAPLARTINHDAIISSMNKSNSDNNTTKIIIIALIIIAVVLAGAFIYLYAASGDSNDDSTSDSNSDVDVDSNDDSDTATASPSSPSRSSSMQILGGSFKTGSSLSDKTYASIYVGSQYAGEDVIIQIYYYNGGTTLNNGNMVSKTVDSNGYIHVRSANAFEYYPDKAIIYLYDSDKILLDKVTVTMSPTSGTQTF